MIRASRLLLSRIFAAGCTALLLAAICGPDSADDVTKGCPADAANALSVMPAPGSLKGARIGVVRGPFGLHARMEPSRCRQPLWSRIDAEHGGGPASTPTGSSSPYPQSARQTPARRRERPRMMFLPRRAMRVGLPEVSAPTVFTVRARE